MKRIIYIILLSAFISCKSNESKQEAGSNDSLRTDSIKTEYTCPMHPDIVSDTPGVCPRCGMDLEAKS